MPRKRQQGGLASVLIGSFIVLSCAGLGGKSCARPAPDAYPAPRVERSPRYDPPLAEPAEPAAAAAAVEPDRPQIGAAPATAPALAATPGSAEATTRPATAAALSESARQAKARRDAAWAAAVARYDAGPGKQLLAEVRELYRVLEDVRRTGTTQQRLDASGRYNTARQRLDALRTAAARTDAAYGAADADWKRDTAAWQLVVAREQQEHAERERLVREHEAQAAAAAAARTETETYAGGGDGSVGVRGYRRKDGTYVRPHNRSAPGSGRKK